MSMRRASFKVVQVYELLWTSTCDSVFVAPKICVEPTQKNAFQIWAITNHKSQICDCNSQTQMSFGNAPFFCNCCTSGSVVLRFWEQVSGRGGATAAEVAADAAVK
jgi:hypothetical protein